jgi:anti-sigma B factor antagonist
MIDIKTVREENTYVLIVSGEADASSSIHLDRAINEAVNSKTDKILVDCSELNYISSAGLGVFMSYIEEMNAANTTMVIYGLNDKVKNIFQILGLDQLLKVVDNEEQAKAAVHEL